MSDAKIERELNLLFVLLNAKYPITSKEIRRRVPGYFDKSDDAFGRMLERDKKMLREVLGVPLITVQIDAMQNEQEGYLIDRKAWQLPELRLTAAERSLINLAKSAWSQTQFAAAFEDAALRLSNDQQIATPLQIELSSQSAHLEQIMLAKSQKKCVSFTYYSRNSASTDERLIAPWRVFLSDGESYLIGFDQLKGEQRTFRLSRVIGQMLVSEEDALEEEPKDLSAAKIIADWQSLNSNAVDAVLEVLKDHAGELRLIASTLELGIDFDIIRISNVDLIQLAKLIAKNCDSVKVISPSELKTEVDNLIGLVINK